MKVNCKALKLSIWISGIFFAFSIISKIVDIKIGINLTNFIKDIMLGIFCSSIVTVFFYISAYKVERKKVLEQYWNEVRKILIELKKIDYMDIKFEPQVFIKFMNEQRNKVWLKQFYKQSLMGIPEKEFENTNNLNFILGDIEFFTGNKNYKKVYELFERIYSLNIKIQESARHFRYYIDGEGNKAFVLSEILKLQKDIFEVKETVDSKIIYSKFIDNMEIKLEEFRANIIYNIEPEKIKIIPLMEISKVSKKNHET